MFPNVKKIQQKPLENSKNIRKDTFPGKLPTKLPKIKNETKYDLYTRFLNEKIPFKAPLIIRLNSRQQAMTKNTTEKKRLQMIKKLIIKIFKKEIHLFKTTEINYENFKNWIKKSINYSHLINFSNYARQSKYLIIELISQLNKYLIKNKFKINYYLKPTTQYGFSEKYLKKNIKNYNSLIYANNLNKIRFYSFNISFLQLLSLSTDSP